MLVLLAAVPACEGSGTQPAAVAAGVSGSTAAVAGAGLVAGTTAISAAGSVSGAAGSLAAGSGAAGMVASSGSSFMRVWNEIILAKGCGSVLCHGGGQGELMMDSRDGAYASLVNVPAAGAACGASGKLRVKAGDPEASLLLDKISHAMPACGAPMPVAVKFAPDCASPSPTLCTQASEVALVRAWIAAGAAND